MSFSTSENFMKEIKKIKCIKLFFLTSHNLYFEFNAILIITSNHVRYINIIHIIDKKLMRIFIMLHINFIQTHLICEGFFIFLFFPFLTSFPRGAIDVMNDKEIVSKIYFLSVDVISLCYSKCVQMDEKFSSEIIRIFPISE